MILINSLSGSSPVSPNQHFLLKREKPYQGSILTIFARLIDLYIKVELAKAQEV